MGGKRCQDFGLLALRDLEDVQGPSEFRCDLIEFRRGYPEVPVRLLKAERRRPGLGGGELERPTRNVADPQRPHEFEAGQSSQVFGVPFPQLRVLGFLADDRILHDGVAEVIYHRRYGEDAAQSLVLFSAVVCACALSAPANRAAGAAASTSPATTLRLVTEVETACVIVISLVMGLVD
jgi:hypothetical protein